MQQAAQKVHKSAVCLIPPYHLIAPIQRIRCFQDKSFVRWPPHINLLYPFWEDTGSSLETAAGRIAQVVKEVAPFKLVLQQLQHFDHGGSCTAWLDATHSSELLSLQASLAVAFPECSDLSSDPGRGITGFVPHLSVGQWRDKAALKQQLQVLQAQWHPLEWEVAEVAIISRQGYQDPFTVRWTIPLGASPAAATAPAASSRPQQVDVPYVATVAADNPWLQVSRADPNHRCRFGLGGVPTGVWNFAYGANMSPQKLGGSRGLHPAASCPGVLQGYSLTFNHRGGFGNIVPAAPAAAAGAGRAVGATRDNQFGQGGGAGRQDQGTAASGAGDAAAGEGRAATAPAVSPAPPQDSAQPSSALSNSSPVGGSSGEAGAAAGGVSTVPQRLLELGEMWGVLHQLTPAQLGVLSNHEHEYWPMEVQVAPCQQLPGATTASTPTSTTGRQRQQQQQQQDSLQECNSPITAVAYISPPDRTTAMGLSPTCRYLSLLQEGARHWQLGGTYTSLLQQQPCLQEGQQRGPEYYTSPEGQPLQAWPKIRTGSEGGSGRGKRGHGRGGGRGTGPAAKRGQAS